MNWQRSSIGSATARPRKSPLSSTEITVDFLAENRSKYFDPHGANEKLDRIVRDDSFKPVFDALTQFVAKANRHLAFTLGNHDIELALPHVRAHFLELLAGTDDAAQGRITLAFDGAGSTN
jgi:hypothetical protein